MKELEYDYFEYIYFIFKYTIIFISLATKMQDSKLGDST